MAVSGRSGRVGGLLFRTHSHSPLLYLATTTAEPRRVAAVDVRIDVLGSLRAEPDAVCHRSRASSPAGYINNFLSFLFSNQVRRSKLLNSKSRPQLTEMIRTESEVRAMMPP